VSWALTENVISCQIRSLAHRLTESGPVSVPLTKCLRTTEYGHAPLRRGFCAAREQRACAPGVAIEQGVVCVEDSQCALNQQLISLRDGTPGRQQHGARCATLRRANAHDCGQFHGLCILVRQAQA
jgi:hypothetical protein